MELRARPKMVWHTEHGHDCPTLTAQSRALWRNVFLFCRVGDLEVLGFNNNNDDEDNDNNNNNNNNNNNERSSRAPFHVEHAQLR